MQIAQQAVWVTLKLVVPILGAALVVGLAVSILQALTQINDQTLTFFPKLLATVLTVVLLGSWMLTMLVDYARSLWMSLPSLI